MASSLLSGAICVLLILIAGYVIFSGILILTETTIMAQKDADLKREQVDHSNITITRIYPGENWVILSIVNDGSSVYSQNDIKKMELFLYNHSSGIYKLYNYTYASIPDHFSYSLDNDHVNKNMWDPGENMNVTINLSEVPSITPEKGVFVTSDSAVGNLSYHP